MGRELSEFIDNADGTLDRARSQLFERGRYDGEMTIRRKDGRSVSVDLNAVLFRDGRTDTQLIITQLRDAAPRQQHQERMKSSARLEAIGQLTGGISHDFNNLLNVIINGAEDLADALAPDHPGRESADLVLSASLKAADLTRQLQAFSRQQPMQVRTLPVAEVLEELRGFLDRAIGTGIRTVVDVAPGIEIRVDQSHLQSALLNLGINARDAMPGGGTLTLSGRHCRLEGEQASRLDLPEGAYVEVCVADTGVGIAPEHLDRVVEPFFTTKGFGQGTGLGLSTAYGFARQSGGALTIDSVLGTGTRVHMYFPGPSGSVRADAADTPESDHVRPGNGQHLLVIEDNDLLGAMLQRILEGGGYRVTLQAQGEAALAALAEMPDVDLVITDIVLGGSMDGWDVARAVQARDAHCPVITMSGYAPGDGSKPAPDTLPSLQKPFRPRQILALVGEVLAGNAR
jgi:signal transduction histidine kinase